MMSMKSMIFVMLIMNNTNLRTLPPSLIGRNNDIGCDIDVHDIYDRCEIDQDKSYYLIPIMFLVLFISNSYLRTLPPSLVGRNNNIGCDKKSSVLRRWDHVVRFVPYLGRTKLIRTVCDWTMSKK